MYILGFQVITDRHIPAMKTKWVYPQERFWSYEPSTETERWCRFFGFGQEVNEMLVYQIGNKLVMHPDILDKFLAACEKEMREQNDAKLARIMGNRYKP